MTGQPVRAELDDPVLHRYLTDHCFAPFVLVGRDLQIHYASPPLTRLLGWEPASVVGRSAVDLLSEDGLALAASGLDEVDSVARDPQWFPTPVQVGILTADGDMVEIDVVARPVRHENFDGFLVQLHPPSPAPRYGEVTRAILDGKDEHEILPMLPPLLERDIPGTRVAIGIGWTGTHFARSVGDDELLALDDPPVRDRPALAELIRSSGDAYALTPSLSDGTVARAADAGFRACWGAPLFARNPVGQGSALVLWHWSDIQPGPIMRGRVDRLIDFARLVLDWADQQRRLAWEVAHDQLTSLLNRGEFMAHLASSEGRGRAVLFCDLDDFKPVNDLHGHRVGDEVLQRVARRMQLAAAPHPVARLSGDEFAVLVQPITGEAEATGVAQAIQDALAPPFGLDEGSATVGVSIGIASDPAGTLAADALVDEADRMLRACKSAGKNTIRSVVV